MGKPPPRWAIIVHPPHARPGRTFKTSTTNKTRPGRALIKTNTPSKGRTVPLCKHENVRLPPAHQPDLYIRINPYRCRWSYLNAKSVPLVKTTIQSTNTKDHDQPSVELGVWIGRSVRVCKEQAQHATSHFYRGLDRSYRTWCKGLACDRHLYWTRRIWWRQC